MEKKVNTQLAIDFDGNTYRRQFDHVRLTNQLKRVYEAMRSGRWLTLGEISCVTKDQPQSISARLRDLRKPKFGSFVIERRHRGDPSNGLYEYCLRRKTNE